MHTHSPVTFETTWPMRCHSLLLDGWVLDVDGHHLILRILAVQIKEYFLLHVMKRLEVINNSCCLNQGIFSYSLHQATQSYSWFLLLKSENVFLFISSIDSKLFMILAAQIKEYFLLHIIKRLKVLYDLCEPTNSNISSWNSNFL